VPDTEWPAGAERPERPRGIEADVLKGRKSLLVQTNVHDTGADGQDLGNTEPVITACCYKGASAQRLKKLSSALPPLPSSSS